MPNVVVVGAQWGDEGKGKIIDLLAEQADAVVRYQGGSNAGHTVVFKGNKYVLHLIPCGILHAGKVCLIGNGVVIDPEALLREIESLRENGFEVGGNLKISEIAHVTLSYHRALDEGYEAKRGEGKIGTTHRGIGPTYRDKYGRIGIRIADLLDSARLERALRQNLEEKNFLFENYFRLPSFQIDELLVRYTEYGKRLKPFVCDGSLQVNQWLDEGKRVLFESAQGTFLDVDFGTYPFVTASNPIAGGVCTGVGIGPTRIEQVLGIVKAYTTRVGEGPMPTEIRDGGDDLRKRGNEFGATTGRPRRCGWFDAMVVKRAQRINGFKKMAVTKLDVLSGIPTLPVCVGYKRNGVGVPDFPAALDEISTLEPVYKELPGWTEDISRCRQISELPKNARDYLKFIEVFVGAEISLVSIGEDRSQTIVAQPVF